MSVLSNFWSLFAGSPKTTNNKAKLDKMLEFDVFENKILIGTFKSKVDCAKKLGLHERSVYRYLDGERKHKSLTFKYKGGF